MSPDPRSGQPGRSFTCRRKRYPIACTVRRTSISGFVPAPRMAAMFLRRAAGTTVKSGRGGGLSRHVFISCVFGPVSVQDPPRERPAVGALYELFHGRCYFFARARHQCTPPTPSAHRGDPGARNRARATSCTNGRARSGKQPGKKHASSCLGRAQTYFGSGLAFPNGFMNVSRIMVGFSLAVTRAASQRSPSA